jgi:hypothetical protein
VRKPGEDSLDVSSLFQTQRYRHNETGGQEYFARLTKPIQLPLLKAPNLPRKSAMRLNAHVMPDRSAMPSPRLDRARRTSLGLFDRREGKKNDRKAREAPVTPMGGSRRPVLLLLFKAQELPP